MQTSASHTVPRRRFLKFLAGSPLAALSGRTWFEDRAEAAGSSLITSPAEAINVFDFEPVARRELPPAHFGYLTTGVDDDATLRANREGFSKFQIRPRRLVDGANVDASVDLLGTTWKSPIVLAPAASQKAFHPDGEIATARAAGAKGYLQILSTGATSSVEDVRTAHGAPIWFQLYPTDTWRITQALVKRAEAAGCPVLVLTVDLPAGRNTETERRFARTDARQCSSCHQLSLAGYVRRKPMFDGLDVTGVNFASPRLTWDVVRRLKDTTTMKLVLKGIETREDAELCVRHGVDSGFRRGTDVFKALALGAKAVCIGRPYLWGLAAFGQPGVARVLEILDRELELMLRHAGVTSLSKLDRSFIVAARRR